MTRDGLLQAAKHVAIGFAFLLCLWKSGSIFGNYWIFTKFGNDFGVYWRAANQSIEWVYGWQGRFPFPYMPTMLVWVSPLQLVAKWPAYFLFIAISAAAFILACRPYLSKVQISLAMASPPFARGIYTGQVCAILTAALIWACASKNRIGAGIAFGIIASIKPQFVIMAPLMFVLNRDWKAFNAAAATFAGTVLMSLGLFGHARWFEWLGAMGHFHRVLMTYDVINIAITPASVAEKFGYAPLPFMILGATIGACVVYVCRSMEPLEKASAIALGSLLAAPYALAYDLTALVPLLVLSIFRGNLLAVPALAALFSPLPLVVSLFVVMRSKLRFPMRRLSHATV